MAKLDLRYGLALLGVFALYVVGGKLGLQLASVHASATAVWPPTGIAIAACLVLGLRMWPAIAAGAFVVNVTTTGDVTSSIGRGHADLARRRRRGARAPAGRGVAARHRGAAAPRRGAQGRGAPASRPARASASSTASTKHGRRTRTAGSVSGST